jgi:hypothetical protein
VHDSVPAEWLRGMFGPGYERTVRSGMWFGVIVDGELVPLGRADDLSHFDYVRALCERLDVCPPEGENWRSGVELVHVLRRDADAGP